jgi:anti-anti-sigma factor
VTDIPHENNSGSSAADTTASGWVDCHGARLRAHARSVATVVAVTGEIDICNGELVSQNLRRFVAVGGPLVVDFAGVTFLGAQGLRDLFALESQFSEARVQWALVAGRPLRRLLQVSDPHHTILVVDSEDQALQQLAADREDRRRLLQHAMQAR